MDAPSADDFSNFFSCCVTSFHFGQGFRKQLYATFGSRDRNFCTSVLFKFSAQHDCRLGRCQPLALRPQMQEHQETSRTTQMIDHSDNKLACTSSCNSHPKVSSTAVDGTK